MASLSPMQDVSLEQPVNVKAKLTDKGPGKHQANRNNQTLQKQEVQCLLITQQVLSLYFGSSTVTLKSGATYSLKNLRLKEENHKRYLNTARSEHFLFSEISAFTDTCINVTCNELLSQR